MTSFAFLTGATLLLGLFIACAAIPLTRRIEDAAHAWAGRHREPHGHAADDSNAEYARRGQDGAALTAWLLCLAGIVAVLVWAGVTAK